VLFAYGAGELGGPVGVGLLHGLKLAAVAIVAQAVWGMARTLCPDRERASIAVAAALIILIGIFLPGVLILMGTLPFRDTFRKRAGAQSVMRGVNAAVVGLLGAALYNPVWTSSVKTPGDFGIALVGFVLLTVWCAPPLVVVIVSALGGIALAQLMS
jgi:chromate transport protein ChrA